MTNKDTFLETWLEKFDKEFENAGDLEDYSPKDIKQFIQEMHNEYKKTRMMNKWISYLTL